MRKLSNLKPQEVQNASEEITSKRKLSITFQSWFKTAKTNAYFANNVSICFYLLQNLKKVNLVLK